MDRYLTLIFAGPEQLFPIGIAVILWIGLAGLGSLVTPKDRLIDANVLFGWAVVSTVFTLVGTWIRAPFFVLTILLAILAVLGIILAIRNRQQIFVPGTWRVLVVAFPLLFIAGAMDPSQWDEFSHWLPAPKYLLTINGFPNAAKPYDGAQMLSAYPYGWPILSYLGGRIAGQFIDNLGGILNVFLLLTFASFAVRTGYRIATNRELERVGWGVAAGITLAATILNPSFVQKIVLTAYSDVATSIGVGFTVLSAYHYLESLAGRGRSSTISAAWQFALLAALLVNLRQPNIVLLVLTLFGMTLLALRDPDISNRHFIGLTAFALLPCLTVYFVWRVYVVREFAGIAWAEASFQPFAEWNIAEIPAILLQMLVVAGKKIGFFAPMAIAVYFAIRGVISYRTAFDRIAILAAAIFLGYNAFLLLTYVGHFGTKNALRVVSYWRYNTQIGALAMMFIVIGGMSLIHRYALKGRYPNWLKVTALGLVIILPLALPHKLRFDLEAPKPHFFRVANDLQDTIPNEAKLWLIDPKGSGESAVILRYVLERFGEPWLSAYQYRTAESVGQYLSLTTPNDYLLVHSTAAGVSEALGLPISKHESYLLQRKPAGWKILRRWQKPADHQG